ncbi:hypothetical protein [Leptospira johnsonii]|uniref:hypothetical protein n=1 Tax=Leptospira johnsonii TaxID=1917820 RepID=UPI00107F3743|nr:hypothetical protein [Leptospira johnsonii]
MSKITAICKNLSVSYAIVLDVDNFGSYQYGEWSGKFIGYGRSAIVITDKLDVNCGYHRLDATLNGNTILDYDSFFLELNSKNIGCEQGRCTDGYHVFYDDGMSLSIGSYLNERLEGFALQDSMLSYPYIGFVENDKFHGEGIYYSIEKNEITHGIWASNKLIKLIKRIDLKKLRLNQPNCNKSN